MALWECLESSCTHLFYDRCSEDSDVHPPQLNSSAVWRVAGWWCDDRGRLLAGRTVGWWIKSTGCRCTMVIIVVFMWPLENVRSFLKKEPCCLLIVWLFSTSDGLNKIQIDVSLLMFCQHVCRILHLIQDAKKQYAQCWDMPARAQCFSEITFSNRGNFGKRMIALIDFNTSLCLWLFSGHRLQVYVIRMNLTLDIFGP